MSAIFARKALIHKGWANNVRLDVDAGRKMRSQPGIYGIVPQGKRFSAAFFVQVPARTKVDRCSFHIEHWVRNTHVGGSSYDFRIAKK